MGKCPVCSVYHYYTSKKGKTNGRELATAFFTSCPKHKDANIDEKSDYILNNKACAKCTDWRHERTACPKKWEKPCKDCKANHHTSLHGSKHVKIMAYKVNHAKSKKMGKCPLCSDYHYYTARKGKSTG